MPGSENLTEVKIIARDIEPRPKEMIYKKILVIEDNEDLLEIISEALKTKGFQVLTTKSGKEGIVLAQKEKPDVIVLDILLDDMDGFDMLAILKEAAVTHLTPIIIYTNLQNTTDKMAGLRLGAEEYYYKTEMPPSKLADKITELIQNK